MKYQRLEIDWKRDFPSRNNYFPKVRRLWDSISILLLIWRENPVILTHLLHRWNRSARLSRRKCILKFDNQKPPPETLNSANQETMNPAEFEGNASKGIQELKGRIVVYSIAACPHCLAAKNTLQVSSKPQEQKLLQLFEAAFLKSWWTLGH